MVSSDGGVYSFGDADDFGGVPGDASAVPVVGVAVDAATGGYWLVSADGTVTTHNATWFGDF